MGIKLNKKRKFYLSWPLLPPPLPTMLPADGIYLYVDRTPTIYDTLIQRDERRIEEQMKMQQSIAAKQRDQNQFDGYFHTGTGTFDAKGKKVDMSPISM